MPKQAKALSALEIKKLTKRGKYAVGGVAGLMIQVAPGGGKSWFLRVKIGHKRRDIGLGGYPTVTLSRAREKAREKREMIEQGIDPVVERLAARRRILEAHNILLFPEAVEQFLKNKLKEFKNKKHAAQWRSTLETYAFPVLEKVAIPDIELNHIVQILEPIWLTKTETAKRLRGRIESVIDWTIVRKYREGENPARWKGNLDIILPAPNKIKKVKHREALPIPQMAEYMQLLRERQGIAARALEFLILTVARSSEARGATWSEIDFDTAIWTIPGDRMKAGRKHRVPLCNDAIKLLKELPRFSGVELLFPAPRGGLLSDNTLGAVMKRMNVKATPHGFRSTFRDWCGEMTNYPNEVAEMALAHAIKNKSEAAYRRGDLFNKRIRLMEDWSKFCNNIGDNVVRLDGVKDSVKR